MGVARHRRRAFGAGADWLLAASRIAGQTEIESSLNAFPTRDRGIRFIF